MILAAVKALPRGFLRGFMHKKEQDQYVTWMAPAAEAYPQTLSTGEFPSGLISDFIEMVDRVRSLSGEEK